MKLILSHIVGLSILMCGYAHVSYGLFRGIVDTTETAVEGAVNVAEDAASIVPATVGIAPYRSDRRVDRQYERRMSPYETSPYEEETDDQLMDTQN